MRSEIEIKQTSTDSLVWRVYPDVARLLGLSKTTVWARVHDGSIPSIKLGRRYVVPKAALEELINGQAGASGKALG